MMNYNTQSKIAIVILNWNGQELLQKFLPTIIKYSSEATIYVVDNLSSDESINMLDNLFPEVKIITNNENYGYSQGYNIALKSIEEPYYCLLNSDIEVTEGWLEPIISIFNTNNEISIIQPKILDYKNKEKFEYAGAAGGFIDKYGFPYCRGRIFDTIEIDFGQYDNTTSIFWASGACFFIRKDVYWELNGFDESFFAHQEEIDLCWRAFNENYKIQYCGTSTVYHIGGATLKYGSPQKTYLNFRNSLLMLYKNLPKKDLFSTIFIRLCLDGIAGLRMLFNGQPTHCFAIIKAHFGFYKRMLFSKPLRLTKQRADYYLTTSIINQYFIKKRKNFNDLI